MVSVIIPTWNEADRVGASVAAARRDYGPEDLEIVVSDARSTDATLSHVPPGVVVVTGHRGRGAQMNRGAAASRGHTLVFCHADTTLPGGWREAVLATLAQPGVSGGAFHVRLDPARGLLRLLSLPRYPAHWRILFGDQVQFTRRSTFEAVGGFPDIPLMEDIELARRLAEVGRLARAPLRVTTSARRFEERGEVRQGLTNAWNLGRYLFLGASPEAVARSYVSRRERGR